MARRLTPLLLVAIFILLPLTEPYSSATAQAAQTSLPELPLVTFYTPGVTMLGGLPSHGHAAFRGRLYDGKQELAFLEPARFVTFSLQPGMHRFSATPWITKNADRGPQVTLDLQPEEHRFVEVYVEQVSLLGAVRLDAREVTCEGAQMDSTHATQLEPKHLRPAGQATFVSTDSFPTCPAEP